MSAIAFVRLARRVVESVPQARFLLVGDGPLRPMVEQAVQALNLRDRVILTGFRGDIPELLATMDVVVLTSLWEGLPFVLLEAMAAQRAVVATHIQGSNEVVVDDETGYLVPPQDPESLATAVIELLQDPTRRERMGRRGRERVEQNFSLERMIHDTVQTYRTVLQIGTEARRSFRQPGSP